MSPKTSTAVAGTASNRQLTSTVSPSDATDAPTTAGLAVSNTGNITWTADVLPGTYTTTGTSNTGNKTDTHVLTLTEPEEG